MEKNKENYLQVLEKIKEFKEDRKDIDTNIKKLEGFKKEFEKETLEKEVNMSQDGEIQLTDTLLFAKTTKKTIDTEKFALGIAKWSIISNNIGIIKNIVDLNSRISINRTNLVKSLKEEFKNNKNVNIKEVIKVEEENSTTIIDVYKVIDLTKK